MRRVRGSLPSSEVVSSEEFHTSHRHQSAAFRRSTSVWSFAKKVDSHTHLNDIRVPSFILSGAPSRLRTAFPTISPCATACSSVALNQNVRPA